MKKLFLLCLMMVAFTPWLQAADGCDQHLSPQEFQAKQRAYIMERAKLTQDEADKFFPLYFELQDKKRELNDKVWKLLRQGEDEATTEEQYNSLMEGVYDARMASDRLEKSYYEKFRKILSAKQIYQVQKAEMQFHRDLLKGMRPKGDPAPKPKEARK
ncbi:MAG: hypothetical protein LUC23_06480 [Prevotellaceae bacterium]|nr:hypothetical protein [Prevotellaceae bacterium]